MSIFQKLSYLGTLTFLILSIENFDNKHKSTLRNIRIRSSKATIIMLNPTYRICYELSLASLYWDMPKHMIKF